MLNKIYEWFETSLGNLRNGVPAAEESDAPRDGAIRRKRPNQCLEDGHNVSQDDVPLKKSRMGDLIDTVKTAAEGVKNHSSSVAAWMKNNVSPTLRNMLPASAPSLSGEPQPSTSAATWAGRQILEKNSMDEMFAAPSTTLEWKTSKSELLRNEKSVIGSKVCRRQACLGFAHREMSKTNGHSVNLPASCTQSPKLLPLPRLGRPLNLRIHGTSTSSGGGSTSSSCTSMYEKTFPIKMVQSPTHSTSSGRIHRTRPHCTAQESVREEEKEVYRQLLTMVSGGQSSFLHNGSSLGIVRSHRDFTSFLSTSRRLLQFPSLGGSAGGTSEGPSSPPSPREFSSQSSSNIPSPMGACSRSGNQTWSLDTELVSSRTGAITSAPSPSTLQDASSQDTQSSAHDGESVIFVKEQKGKKQDISSVPYFQAELWIRELSSMYDSRARERRRQIEEQEILAALLRGQRLTEEGQHRPEVEVRVRVPLEKEVPLTLVIEEPKPFGKKPEFPALTEVMEAEVDQVLRGDDPDEVLSEGFGQKLTRKDLQTLSHLNWLNDEVINFYMNLLVERSKDSGLPSVNTFNTFFYPKLRSSGYSAVRRWTKKMDIFSLDVLLVPVHSGVHWCLSVVDFRKKTIMYFDSMGGNDDGVCRLLLDYLQKESKDKKNKELDASGWTLHTKRRNEIPQQMNGSDCGMFTCKYADYITKDKPITFTQKHMPYFRRRMVWEIVKHKLL